MKIFPLIRNHRTNPYVDEALREVVRQLESGEAINLGLSVHRQYCTLSGGTKAEWWGSNQMYAYASDGHVGVFTWYNAMPSRHTALRLRDVFTRRVLDDALKSARGKPEE